MHAFRTCHLNRLALHLHLSRLRMHPHRQPHHTQALVITTAQQQPVIHILSRLRAARAARPRAAPRVSLPHVLEQRDAVDSIEMPPCHASCSVRRMLTYANVC
jgi:hypothetical protein